MISRITSRLALLGATAVLAVGLAGAAAAADFTKEHLAAARAAMYASKSTTGIDEILINLTNQTKETLVKRAPAAATQIEEVTNAVALELAARRTELDGQMQEIWAARFSKEELDEITKFFNSPTGTKCTKEIGPMSQMLGIAAQVWQKKLSEEMVTKVRAEMKKRGVEF
jgi:hypothetical protein